MARIKGQRDKSTLRFTTEEVKLARLVKEKSNGPIWGELNVLLYGNAVSPDPERWRLIRSGEEDRYWVSDQGHFAVWREDFAAVWQRNQYLQAVLCVDGRRCPRAIHTLVARMFCQWKPGDTLVRHLNSNPVDNHANNLRPGRPSENGRDRQVKGRGVVPEILSPAREIWKLSPEYPGVRVSNLGRVRLGWWVAFNTGGYSYKQGSRVGTRKHVSVKVKIGNTASYELLHRLVYEAFTGAIPPDAQIRHLDDNPHNNRVDNLAVGTPAQNVGDRNRNGHQRYGEDHPHAKYTNRQRATFLQLVASGMTRRAAALKVGIPIATGYQICWRLRNGLPIKTG